MDNAHLLSNPMIVGSLDPKKDLFHPKEDDEEILAPAEPYMNVIGVLLYLAQCSSVDMIFLVSLLARFSFALARRH